MPHETLRIGPLGLPGELTTVPAALGLVLFVHGSGSSRLSPRNRQVAGVLNEHRLATVLFDLLTETEAADRRNVFDIALLARRVGEVIDALRQREDTGHLPLGLFGASTGAAAALRAAAEQPQRVAAVVSRGGRPDLAGEHLALVRAPTLLIVGGNDTEVLALNRSALHHLLGTQRLEIVPGATHLFEEAGALEQVAKLAAAWFAQHLGRASSP